MNPLFCYLKSCISTGDYWGVRRRRWESRAISYSPTLPFAPNQLNHSSFDEIVNSKFPLPSWEGMKGRGMNKQMKLFNSSPSPRPSPIKGEGVLLTFCDSINFDISGYRMSPFSHQRVKDKIKGPFRTPLQESRTGGGPSVSTILIDIETGNFSHRKYSSNLGLLRKVFPFLILPHQRVFLKIRAKIGSCNDLTHWVYELLLERGIGLKFP